MLLFYLYINRINLANQIGILASGMLEKTFFCSLAARRRRALERTNPVIMIFKGIYR